MTYAVRWTKQATKDVDRLGRKTRDRIIRAVEALAENPRGPNTKPLRGSDDWRLRVGDFRVIYSIDDGVLVVLVLRVRPRGGAYKK